MNEVATTKAQNLVADKPERIEVTILDMEDKFAKVLPNYITPARFVRSVLGSLDRPEVKKATATPRGRRSITESCLKAANDGLLLDGREAALVPIKIKIKDENDRDQYIDGVRYDPMVAGILKKARNSDEISTIVCQVVHENDPFSINFVTDGPPVEHSPCLKGPRGAIIGCYAVTRFKDGFWSEPEWMTLEDLHKNRARSTSWKNGKDGNKGPWESDFGEMARKSTLKRHSKKLPSSTDRDGKAGFAELLDRDNAEYEPALPGPAPTAPRIMAQEQTTQDVTSPPAKQTTKKGAAALLSEDTPSAGENRSKAPVDDDDQRLDEAYAERGYDGNGEVIDNPPQQTAPQAEPEL